jgi:hypothetical protein
MEAVRFLKRKLGGGKPIVGYAPHWYTGHAYLGFFDVLVASSYVSGTGRPEDLYARVPASWWTEYGKKKVDLLQFSSSARMDGFAAAADCSAFRGTFAELDLLLMGRAATEGLGYRQKADGEHSLDEVAHDRGTSVDHIVRTTRQFHGITASELEAFETYYEQGNGAAKKMPEGLIFFTSRPGSTQ